MFGLEIVELTRRQEKELELAELQDVEILFRSDKDGQDLEQAHQRDRTG